MSGYASLIKANEISDSICIYPTSNPVDSTDLKERQTNIGNKGTHRKLSLKVDTVRRCPDRKLSVRRKT